MKKTGYQTVVVGVDFSEYSKVVVKQGVKLAEAYGARLVFVHVLSSAYFMIDRPAYVDAEAEIITPMTRELISYYGLDDLPGSPKAVVRFGRPSESILAVAENFPDPLIVVGHKGHSRLGRLFLGSTAESLALHSHFPVWIQRGNKVRLPNKILLPCDFSERQEKSYQCARGLATGDGKAKYEFFHVQSRPVPVLDAAQWKKTMQHYRRYEERQKKEFQSRYPKIAVKDVSGDPSQSILKEARKFDVIAMAPHNREGLFSGFGSVTAKVVREGDTPILITP